MTEQEIAAKEKQPVEGQEKTRAGRFFLPQVDIYEFGDSIKLWADMAGVKESDVNITLKDGVLTITGTVSTNVYEKLSPQYTEYNVGNHFRQFRTERGYRRPTDRGPDEERVLELTLPKGERAQPRQIEVKAG
jgi:HSP20 family protein